MSKSIVRSIKNVANGYTNAQVKVRNATSNEAYGPATEDMQEIANRTFDNGEILEIMDMIDRRLNDKGKNWRHVAKALTLLDYCVRCGSKNVVLWSKDNIYIIKTLREFIYVDESGHDKGAIIRVKAKELTSLLLDDERIRSERAIRKGGRRNRGPERRPTHRERDNNGYDPEMERALGESKITAEEEERRRKNQTGNVDEAALNSAIKLSEEEYEYQNNNHTGEESKPVPNLLDLEEPQQPLNVQVVQYTLPTQQTVSYQTLDMYGNPIYGQGQQPMSTGFFQNAYSMGGAPNPQAQNLQYGTTTGGFQMTPEQQQFLLQQQQQQQLQQQQALQQQQTLQQPQQPLQPLKTGSNNPFALSTPNSAHTAQQTANSLSALAQKQQQQQLLQQQQQQQNQQQQLQFQNQQQLQQQNTKSNAINDQYSELNNLLAAGDGIDTFGNTGETRIAAQHTQTQNFINSAGTGFKTQPTGTANPFFGAQYTGLASTAIQPAFTGVGFGNAPGYQNQQQQQQQQPGNQGLINF